MIPRATRLAAEARRSGIPFDLREAGRTDDPKFERPLVYGRIDTGVVEVRRPGSDVVERHVVKPPQSGKEVPSVIDSPVKTTHVEEPQTSMGEADVAADKPSERTEKSAVPDLTRRVAELYNSGTTWREMGAKLKLSPPKLSEHVRLARELGLITKTRVSGRKVEVSEPETQSVADAEVAMVDSVPANKSQGYPSSKGAAVNASGASVSEDRRRDTGDLRDLVQRLEGDIHRLVSGLSELTRRVEALEHRQSEANDDDLALKALDVARDVLRVLEVALVAGDRRMTA